MNKTLTPRKTPSPTYGEPKTRTGGELQLFLTSALNMSWQLALVVLVPVIGGFELDKRLNTLPVLTIIGLMLAGGGTGLVVRRQLQLFGPAKVGNKGQSS